MITDLQLVSELHATLGGLSPEKARQKLVWCSMELSGTDPICSRLVSKAMDVAIQGGNAQDYLGRKLKKLVDSL